MTENNKAVIFDLGNVLINFDHRIAAQRIVKFTDKNEQEIFDLFFDSELTGLFEEGKITPPQFFSKVKEILNLNLGFDEFVPIWSEIFFFTAENLAVYNLADKLKNRYRTALLSNINILHYEYIKKAFPFIDSFRIITSFEAGFRKPQSQIYQKALDILRTAPGECFYTDDRPELIEGAKGLGIRGFVFKGAEQLKKDLIDSGINID